MTTATQKELTKETKRHTPREQVAVIKPPRLPFIPEIEERFGVDKASWMALVEGIFPNATSTGSIVLALSYCKARNLDPFKRNVHIVPIWNKAEKQYIDTIWPAIGELRTTAFRTGDYAGRGETIFGPDISGKVGSMQITYPEWAQVTLHRFVKRTIVDFVGPRVYWIETYATKSHEDDTPKEMWATRPRGQLDKCAEAAALRCAFPEEVGSEYIPEEVQHTARQTIDAVSRATRINSLSAVTERIERQNEVSRKAKPEAIAAAVPVEDDDVSAELDTPEDLSTAYLRYQKDLQAYRDKRKVYDHWFGPERRHDWPEEYATEAVKDRDKAMGIVE